MRHGNAGHWHDMFVQSFRDGDDPGIVHAIVEPQLDLGIRQVFAKELRCRTPRFADHPLDLDEALAAFEEEVARWGGMARGPIKMAMVIEANAHWTASGMSTEDLICRGHALAKGSVYAQQSRRPRHVFH